MDPYTGPRDVPGEDDGQPLTEPYDERACRRSPPTIRPAATSAGTRAACTTAH